MTNHLRAQWRASIERTASSFAPAQVSAWATSQPWNAARKDLEAQMVPGITVGQARGSEVASFQDGKIVLKDQWFDYPTDARRSVLYHEAGHGLETKVGLMGLASYFGVDNPLDIIDLPGAQRFGYNCSEVVAEAYAVLWNEPHWASFEGGQAILDAVEKMALDHGWPVP